MARVSVCKRVYIDKGGVEYGNMPADPSVIVSQEFRFTDGTVRERLCVNMSVCGDDTDIFTGQKRTGRFHAPLMCE